jgi:hypothetical protein
MRNPKNRLIVLCPVVLSFASQPVNVSSASSNGYPLASSDRTICRLDAYNEDYTNNEFPKTLALCAQNSSNTLLLFQLLWETLQTALSFAIGQHSVAVMEISLFDWIGVIATVVGAVAAVVAVVLFWFYRPKDRYVGSLEVDLEAGSRMDAYVLEVSLRRG